MTEFVLYIGLVLSVCPLAEDPDCGTIGLSAPIEVGAYESLGDCEAGVATVKPGRPEISFISWCVERDI